MAVVDRGARWRGARGVEVRSGEGCCDVRRPGMAVPRYAGWRFLTDTPVQKEAVGHVYPAARPGSKDHVIQGFLTDVRRHPPFSGAFPRTYGRNGSSYGGAWSCAPHPIVHYVATWPESSLEGMCDTDGLCSDGRVRGWPRCKPNMVEMTMTRPSARVLPAQPDSLPVFG